MALTPKAARLNIGQTLQTRSAADQTTRTYRVDWNTRRVVGFTDTLDATRQAIFKILETERWRYLIYPWRYGVELTPLFGETPAMAAERVQPIVEAALLADRRITGILDFAYIIQDKRTLFISFTAQTIFGAAYIERQVVFGG